MRFWRWLGRNLVAFLRWSAIQIFRASRHVAREIWRLAHRTLFGNWRRALVTLAIVSLFAVKYFPHQTTPTVEQFWKIGFTLLGVRILAIPFWPLGKKKKK
jgi:hypothetical protein